MFQLNFMKNLLIIVAAFFVCIPLPANAFYSTSQDDISFALGGFVGAGGYVAKYPGNGLYEKGSSIDWFGDFRLLADVDNGDDLVAKINVLQNVRSTPDSLFAGNGQFARDAERSGYFYWQQHDSPNTQSAMVLDTAYIKYGNWSNEVTLGRQPVSTTVTFFFTPNDFFAPFSADTFFRVYKPGVDAVRYERKLKNLSQLSVIGVLGYERKLTEDSGWSNSPDWENSSLFARVTHTMGIFELGALGGVVRESAVTGFSLQGELFDWLGIRTEGHYANSWSEEYDSGLMATVSFEHRYPDSLTLRIEYMYNGYGEDTVQEALLNNKQGVAGQKYLGLHYTALDLSYEITPLLFGEILFLRNWSDDSYSLSFNAVYSVSDESDLTMTLSLPGGTEPESGFIQSELGSMPIQFGLEYRHFF